MKKKEVLIVLALLGLFGGFYAFTHLHNDDEQLVVRVYYRQKIIDTIDVSKDHLYSYTGEVGTFHLEVKNGRYRAVDVDCPNKICEHVGWVSLEDEKSIICAPNRISVVIETK